MTAADLALAHAAEGRVGGVCMVSGYVLAYVSVWACQREFVCRLYVRGCTPVCCLWARLLFASIYAVSPLGTHALFMGKIFLTVPAPPLL